MARKRNIMRRFSIGEISGVDRPAQTPARATLMKRRGDPKYKPKGSGEDEEDDDMDKVWSMLAKEMGTDGEIARTVVVTSQEDGHTHALWLSPGMRGGETGYATTGTESISHDHPWAYDEEGNIFIGANDGHSHMVDMRQVASALLSLLTKDGHGKDSNDPDQSGEGEDEMPGKTPTKKAAAETEAPSQSDFDALMKRAERLESVNGLSPEHRAHFDKVEDESVQDEFLAKSETERQAVLDDIEKGDPIVYTTVEGDVVRKSDGALMAKLAKRNDELAKENAEGRAARKNASFEKRAEEELAHLPGTTAQRAAMLKAIDAIPNEDDKAAALDALKAGDKAISAGFDQLGVVDGRVDKNGSGEAELEKIAKRIEKDEGISYLDAYEKAGEQNPEILEAAIFGKPISQ